MSHRRLHMTWIPRCWNKLKLKNWKTSIQPWLPDWIDSASVPTSWSTFSRAESSVNAHPFSLPIFLLSVSPPKIWTCPLTSACFAPLVKRLLGVQDTRNTSCSFYSIDCLELGARLTLNSTCYDAAHPLFSSDSSGLYLVLNNEPVLHHCGVSNQIGASLAMLEYSKFFNANYSDEIICVQEIDGANVTFDSKV